MDRNPVYRGALSFSKLGPCADHRVVSRSPQSPPGGHRHAYKLRSRQVAFRDQDQHDEKKKNMHLVQGLLTPGNWKMSAIGERERVEAVFAFVRSFPVPRTALYTEPILPPFVSMVIGSRPKMALWLVGEGNLIVESFCKWMNGLVQGKE